MRALVAIAALAPVLTSLPVSAFDNQPLGGNEGEVDINAHFIAELGSVEPTVRPTTWQDADIKLFNVGAGYTVGAVGPMSQFYLRVDGGYYIAGEEAIIEEGDDLPVGYQFFDVDKGGFVSATIAASFVNEPRLTFGAFLQGTVPIDVELQKFSSVHLHYVAGGTTLRVFLTDPDKLFRLGFSNRIFFGSGAYDGDFQHNAAVAMSGLLHIELARWLLPWRVGLWVGPYFEGDLNDHINSVYHEAYARVTPDYVKGDDVRALSFSIAVLPFIRITDHAALELGYVQRIFGYDARATQLWTAGVRVFF